jgi:bacterioferritin-associated ferredoxin
MYVCVCQAVTSREIEQAANNGAKTLQDLRRDLNIASECGRCAACARNCLKAANQNLVSIEKSNAA